jgi:hypothetical protein
LPVGQAGFRDALRSIEKRQILGELSKKNLYKFLDEDYGIKREVNKNVKNNFFNLGVTGNVFNNV